MSGHLITRGKTNEHFNHQLKTWSWSLMRVVAYGKFSIQCLTRIFCKGGRLREWSLKES